MDYDSIFRAAIDRLHAEGRYRVFVDILRTKGNFPDARCFGGNGPKPITVWCSNDYLAMGQHPSVISAMETALQEVGAGSGGTRSISGKVVNIGEVFIPLGVTLFAGAFTQGQAGRLRVEIGGTDPVNYASYWPEVVSKTSQRQNEAWDFIRFVSDRTELSNYLEATKRVSPRRDVPGLGELEAFYKQNESAVTWYKGDTARANAIFVDLIRRVVGGEDIARAIDRAATEETAVLQDVKQRFGVPQ